MSDIDTINDEELVQLTSKIYSFYTQKPFVGDVKWSNRLKTSGGNIRYNVKSNDCMIHLNREYAIKFGKLELVEIIKHELGHYYLFKEGCFKHGHGNRFKSVLMEIFHCNKVHARMNEDNYKYIYRCQACGGTHQRTRRINKRIYCSQCVKEYKGKIKNEFQMLLNQA